jgi:acetate kinase
VYILVLNCGSSSLKFQIIETDLELIEKSADRWLAKGVIERIGSESLIALEAAGKPLTKKAAALRDHQAALEYTVQWIVSEESKIEGIHTLADIHAIGHRVVHGGETFRTSVVINDDVIKGIEDCLELAPLHNPANLKGIYAARKLFGPNIPQAAVFDTAFHSTMPESSYLYAIPYQLYRRHKIRKYGFHGTSHRYVAYRYRQLSGKTRDDTNVISLHLGNGCSACAIKGGNSMDTSMGMTPLEGLVMGTRSGDVDPGMLEFLSHKEGMSLQEIDNVLNKQSGLLGISGLTNDMRELIEEEREHSDRRAKLAIEIFCKRVKKYLGGYLAEMNGADAIIFTGGIGENSPLIRSHVLSDLKWLGIELDPETNNKVFGGKESVVSTPSGRVTVYVIPTNEELLIARDTVRSVSNAPRRF